MEEMEDILNEEGEQRDYNVKFKLRKTLEWSVVEMVVTEHPNLLGDAEAAIRRVRATVENPEFEGIACIANPEELIAIARMALIARERLLELQAAKPILVKRDDQK